MQKKFMFPLMEAVAEGAGGGPADLGDVISSSLEGLEGRGDEGGDGAPAEVKPAAPVAEPNEEQELAQLAAEWRAKNPQAKGNMTIDRHQAVLTRNRNQQEKALKEWQAKEQAWQKEQKEYKDQLTQWEQYKWAQDPDMQYALAALDLSERDPKKFAELLLADPRYAELLSLTQAPQVPDNRPGPNARSTDGKYEYYDDEGVKKLLEWHGAQTAKRVEEKLTRQFEAKLNERLGEFKGVKDQYELGVRWSEAKTTQLGILNNAREHWPGFKENEGKCKQYMIANPKSDIAEAYREVVVKGMVKSDAEKEAAWKAKYQQDMERKRLAAGGVKPAAGSGVERMAGNKDDKEDMGDVIKNAIRNLPR